MVRCSVLGCKSDTDQKIEGLSFHIFPTKPRLRNVWIAATGRAGWQPKHYSKICSKHFDNSFLMKKIKKTYLDSDAVPTQMGKDTVNYMKYQMGFSHRLILCDDAVPSKFDCQERRKAFLRQRTESIYPQSHNGPESHIESLHRNNTLQTATIKQEVSEDEHHKKEYRETKKYTEKPRIKIKTNLQQPRNENGISKTSYGATESLDTMLYNASAKSPLSNTNETLECRACLENVHRDNLIDMFQSWSSEHEGIGVTVAEDLSNLTRVQISIADIYSKYICMSCHQRLLDSCMFITKVQRSQQILKERYNSEYNESDWPKPIQIHNNNSVLIGTESVEIKQEVLSEDENLEQNSNSDNANQMMEIKVEPEEIVEPKFEEHSDSVQQNDVHFNSDEIKQSNSPLQVSKDLMPFRITVNGTISTDQFEQTPVMTIHGDIINDKEFQSSEVSVKEEPISDNEDSELTNEVPLECMLCMKSFATVLGLKVHVIAQHSYVSVHRDANGTSKVNSTEEEKVCSICRRSFKTTTDLMVHETCHGKYACYGCQDQFDSYEILSNHTKTCKRIDEKRQLRLKTLDDVKRPRYESPESEENDVALKKMNYNIENSDYDMERTENLESDFVSD